MPSRPPTLHHSGTETYPAPKKMGAGVVPKWVKHEDKPDAKTKTYAASKGGVPRLMAKPKDTEYRVEKWAEMLAKT